MRTLSAFAAAVALAGATTATAGLLVNESFDDGSKIMWKDWATDNTDIPGWKASVDKAVNQWASWSVSDGTIDAKVGVHHFEIAAGLFQTAAAARPAAIAGATYTLNFSTRMNDHVWESTRVYIDFFNDASYTPVASSAAFNCPNEGGGTPVGGAMRSYSLSVEAPMDVTSVGVRIVQQARSYNQSESFDNFVLTVPEPASLAVLGLAGLLLGRRRS